MGFDDKILQLSRTIYQTSVMDHGSKNNPTGQINKIKDMIREFIRMEVVPYELTNQEKMSFILDNELKITYACLLYTSPSPRDRTRSRMPSSA